MASTSYLDEPEAEDVSVGTEDDLVNTLAGGMAAMGMEDDTEPESDFVDTSEVSAMFARSIGSRLIASGMMDQPASMYAIIPNDIGGSSAGVAFLAVERMASFMDGLIKYFTEPEEWDYVADPDMRAHLDVLRDARHTFEDWITTGGSLVHSLAVQRWNDSMVMHRDGTPREWPLYSYLEHWQDVEYVRECMRPILAAGEIQFFEDMGAAHLFARFEHDDAACTIVFKRLHIINCYVQLCCTVEHQNLADVFARLVATLVPQAVANGEDEEEEMLAASTASEAAVDPLSLQTATQAVSTAAVSDDLSGDFSKLLSTLTNPVTVVVMLTVARDYLERSFRARGKPLPEWIEGLLVLPAFTELGEDRSAGEEGEALAEMALAGGGR